MIDRVTSLARIMRVLVLVGGLVQLALYGASAPATGAPSPAFLRLTEEQRLYSTSPAQTAILTQPQVHPVKGAAPDPGPVPQAAGPVAPDATGAQAMRLNETARPRQATLTRPARGPPPA